MAREQFQTLTEPMYYILLALTRECCGVDIMERVRQISAMLSKFEENNVIKKTTETGRRKSYIITETGMQMLKDEYERLKAMIRDGEDNIDF